MLIGGVVHNQINEHANATLLGAMGKIDKIAKCAVARIDAVIVRDVVPVIAMRRGLERHQPNGGDAEAVQIVEPPRQAAKIADAVTIGIHVGADREAINDGILVPEVADHAASLPRSAALPTMTPSFGCRTRGAWQPARCPSVDKRTCFPDEAERLTSTGPSPKLSATSTLCASAARS